MRRKLKMITVQARKAEYIFVVHEFNPLWDNSVAFRRKRANELYTRRKYVKCPYCSQRLFDMNPDTKVEMYRYPERASELSAQAMYKCTSCNGSVGVNYIF